MSNVKYRYFFRKYPNFAGTEAILQWGRGPMGGAHAETARPHVGGTACWRGTAGAALDAAIAMKDERAGGQAGHWV